MAWCMFGATLHEPMLNYCQLESGEHIQVTYDLYFKNIPSNAFVDIAYEAIYFNSFSVDILKIW